MSTPGPIETLSRVLGDALSPLEQRLQGDGVEEVLEQLGLRLPTGSLASGNVPAALQASANACSQLPPVVAQLVAAISGGNDVAMITAAVTLGQRIVQAGAAFTQLASALDNVVQSAAGLTPAQTARLRAAAQAIPERLLHLALISYLEERQPAVKGALDLTGIFDDISVPGDPADPSLPPHHLKQIRFDRLGPLVSDPLQHLKDLYGFGRPDFDGLELFRRVKAMVDRPDAEAIIITAPGQPTALEAFIFRLAVAPGAIPGLRIRVRTPAQKDFDVAVPLGGPWSATASAQARFETGIEFLFHPETGLRIEPPAATATVALAVGLKAENADGRPLILIGQAGGSRLELLRFASRLPLKANASTGSPSPDVKLAVEMELKQGKLVIDTSQADGFIGTILGGVKVESAFDLGAVYDTDKGLRFNGSATIEIAIPTHLTLGPISIPNIYLIGGFKDGTIPIEFSADIGAELGPLSVSVNRLGATANVSFPNGGGNAGPAQIDVTFKPPNGAGLSLDAGGFKGGGFLMFDSEKGEYAGALELDFQGMFSVKAIGIVNTKMPDGSPGFSLLIVISAEFTPIQLSFGFTLNGVGGIIGLNRTLVVAALADGIRTNAIKSILFPENVIANISRIISDIKQFFPPQNDHFLIGPMAKLGWGTPSLVTLELGLLLDLPNPMFAIVGVLKAVLPNEEVPILRLQVNFIGIVDFEHGYVFFRADLYDSRLLIYSITGSMAFLVSWGEQQTFALSVGGFHPDFRDFPSIPALPDGFRNMARIGISLLSDDNPRLKVESYFAVTSNTVQFGARVELYAEAAGFNVYGFLGYDVLFQFDPFRFIADLHGGIALREGTSVIAGISISAKLSGPNPWDARGDASLTILFFEISVGFHVTWGDPPPAIAPATEDLLRLLQADLGNTHNWRADLPPDNHLHVSLKKIEPAPGDETLVIHPAGVLTFSQRSMPLEDYLIEKFGNKKPLAENKFKLTNANSGGTLIPSDYQNIREQFAPGNFTELSDSEKLSRKSFEALPSGFKLSATSDLLTTMPVTRPVEYELSYLRRKKSGLVFKIIITLAVRAYDRLVKGSAVRQSVLSLQQTRTSLNAPAQVGLPQESFALANTADLRSHSQNGNGPELFATQAEAYQRHRELITANPALAGQIQVVSHFELNPN